MLSGRTGRRVGAGCALLIAFGVAAAPSLVANAAATPSFDGRASAYAFLVQAANSGLPFGLAPEVDGATAQSHLTSFQQSESFAAMPYLGDAVTGLPGLAGSLVGAPLPAYPLIVNTAYGDEPAHKSFGAITVDATSDLSTATAKAMGGSDSAGSSSSTRVAVSGDESVKAQGIARVDGLGISGVLSVGAVRSVATATRDASGALTTSSDLVVSDIGVPGLQIGVPDCTPTSVPVPVPGLPALPSLPSYCLSAVPVLGGVAGMVLDEPELSYSNGAFTVTTVPKAGLPSVTVPVPSDAVVAALQSAGFSATFSKEVILKDVDGKPDGISGATLTLSRVVPEPPPPVNSQVHGPTTISITLGRVTAQVDYAVAPGGSSFAPGTTSPLAQPSAVATVPAAGNVPAADTPGLGPGQMADAAVPQNLPPQLAGSPTADSAPRLASRAFVPTALTLLDMREIYLAVAATAVIALLGSTLLRYGGVRSR